MYLTGWMGVVSLVFTTIPSELWPRRIFTKSPTFINDLHPIQVVKLRIAIGPHDQPHFAQLSLTTHDQSNKVIVNIFAPMGIDAFTPKLVPRSMRKVVYFNQITDLH
jgi:hypothetical protein